MLFYHKGHQAFHEGYKIYFASPETHAMRLYSKQPTLYAHAVHTYV